MNININLIKKQGDLYDLILRDNKILELYHNDTQEEGRLSFFIYEPKENTITEICPEIVKNDFIHIRVSYMPCREIYFGTYEKIDDETVDILIYSYDLSTKESREICSFRETADVLTGKKRIKIFVLSKTQLLIQTEVLEPEASAALMGNIVFSQALYNTETNEPIDIVEENFINNGINTIIALNETEIMVKTGFSFLEDSRIAYNSEKDALIESVYVTTNAKLLSDISLKMANIDMKLLTSAYFDKYILRPEFKDQYIYYNVINVKDRESDCVFYNIQTGEKMTAKNTDIDLNDLHIAYVINNTPYVRKYIENSCEFVNLNSAENDISFYDEDFIDVCGNLFITYRRHGRKNHMRVYKYPHMDLLLEETCNYTAGITKDFDYYIYVER